MNNQQSFADRVKSEIDRLPDPDGTYSSVEINSGNATRMADPIEGSEILLKIQEFLRRFVSYPDEHCLLAHTLWIAHTHLIESFESTPRLAFLSPEPASGKTRALEITEMLVPNPVIAVNVTPAYLFRKVGDEGSKPTILYDEIDTIFGPKAKANEEIRGLLNAGHRKGAVAGRCVVRGTTVSTEESPAYSAVALAGLGGLPDTILTRSIIINMRRRAPDEEVEQFRRRIHVPEGDKLREQLALWCESIVNDVRDVFPDMPEEITDRNADMWEPLLAIADAAGGEWPSRSRVTAVTLVTQAKEKTPSLGIQLLSDLREIFIDHPMLFTADIVNKLNSKDESPWGNLRGQPLDARGLGRLLRPYDIKSTTVRTNAGVAKGYKAVGFHEAWTRYLPPLTTEESVTRVTKVTEQSSSRAGVTSVTDVTDF
ncbi:MAG: DUF3631 domain-containing protein [Proteobacteria bacterium]|nr:DUF3631 domain-containing protein [Pseudomonadota bacterium]